jgi:hypothetical protein
MKIVTLIPPKAETTAIAPAWAEGLLVPLRAGYEPQRGPCRFPPIGGDRATPQPGCLPYGWWTLADGSEVLFSRTYTPLWHRDPSGVVTRADPSQWIHWVRQEWFHDDSNPPNRNRQTRERLIAVLARWGVGKN